MNSDFRFKQFTVRQEKAAMKIGTDGVLLGAWARLEQAGCILDIGTGTGVIALMAAQRNPAACIDAVEIEDDAAEQAAGNIAASPWKERITLHHLSIFDYAPPAGYDYLICNPPFFNRSTPTPESSRNTARHCIRFSHEELLKKAALLLTPQGRFSLILPPKEAEELIRKASLLSLFPLRITRVKPTPDLPVKRWLIELSRMPVLPEESELVIEWQRHRYTAEYIALTKEFYLYL
ncbi:MAG: methyltransferase [Culturomica sp.]|nr:methyltransferase [Culturomica sp.]